MILLSLLDRSIRRDVLSRLVGTFYTTRSLLYVTNCPESSSCYWEFRRFEVIVLPFMVGIIDII